MNPGKIHWGDPDLIIYSNPRMFTKSKQYNAVLNYCKNKGKETSPLIFNKYVDGEELNMLLIGDLTYGEYLWVMDNIKYQKKLKATNIIPSQKANYVNIVILLGELEKDIETEFKSDTYTDVLTFDKTQSINVYPNPAGNFVNGFWSMPCNWVYILEPIYQSDSLEDNEVIISFHYNSDYWQKYPDPRLDPRIVERLKADRKIE
jgi:hypothetical protein